jgi:diguanylate cyclase (GGDEF)-like protein/PAS domain S-box-containing protein
MRLTVRHLIEKLTRAGLRAALLAVLFVAAATTWGSADAWALKPIAISPDQDRVEITTQGELYDGRGDSLQVETAAGPDAMTDRMSVHAVTPGTNPNWIVFALTNPTDKPVERWLTAERYNVIGSGAIWPDLDARRIEAVTPSVGFVPERIKSDRADIFRITLEPGQTITYVAELAGDRFARVYLWKPLDYELKTRDRQLFNGIMLGLTGLLAIFLTAIFAANHKVIFPAAALVSWCVLAYLCVDFGFFHKLFNLRPEDNAVYRAAGESAIAASLVIFLSMFLRLPLWHGLIRMLIGVWTIAQIALIAVAIIDPRLASTFARMSFLAIGGFGAMFTLLLAFRGQDRALALIPTWVMFLVWIFAAGVTLTGRLSGDMVVSGLVAGLVLIVLLIGFTVTQFAFRSLEPLYGTAPSELQIRSLAVDGAGAAVWEWNSRRDEVKIAPAVEASLGLNVGELSSKVEDFSKHLHPADRERFRLMLWSAQERAGTKINVDFRMRHADNSYRWFELEAASVPNSDSRSLRCVGLMRDVTHVKRASERLMHDAVHCSLTGLPHRALFIDRLNTAVLRARTESNIRPTVMFIDIDKFKSVNASFGLVIGDSLLLTIARRLQRHVGVHDTLARVGGDQFALMFLNEQDPHELASLAERVRRSLRAPIKIAGQEVVLTGSVGLAVFDGEEASSADLLKEAEIAMYRAKRGGADRIEIFKPEMRGDRDDRVAVESDLRKALERNQIRVLYQPIVYLPTEELAGFEALVRWEHPKQGLLNPTEFVPVAEESDLIVKLGSHVLLKAAHAAARWQKELSRADSPLFVSVNISSKQLFRQDLVQEIRHILGRNVVPKGSLRLEVTEGLVMENPEQATEILEWLRGAGADLALDDFGTGYSSLAYLHRFPFDTIKIDKTLIQASGSGTGNASVIVRSMVALAHELGKKVVAEGVEDPDDVGFLRSIGCEYGQGFYYGEPMNEADVMQLLKIVRKAEHKLQPRGFFRTKLKRKDKKHQNAEVAVASAEAGPANAQQQKPAAKAAANGATPPATKEGARASKGGTLRNRTVRPRTRTAAPPAANAANGAHPPSAANGAAPNAAVPSPGSPAGPSGPGGPAVTAPPPAASASAAKGARAPAPDQKGPPPLPGKGGKPMPPPANTASPSSAFTALDTSAFALPPGIMPTPPAAQQNGAPMPKNGAPQGPHVAAPLPGQPPAHGGYPQRPGPGVSNGPAPGPNGARAQPMPGQPVQQGQEMPDLSHLPPGIAASLARLAGVLPPPNPVAPVQPKNKVAGAATGGPPRKG